MKSQILRAAVAVITLIYMGGFCPAAVKGKVTGDNVNLRSAPTNTSEIVGQVSTGEMLETVGAVGGWMQVVPPEEIDLWVYAEFAPEEVVAVSRLKVRSGPGINYKTVAILEKGDKVQGRGVKGEWLKIAPPEGSAVWISADYLEIQKPEQAVLPVRKVETVEIERTPPKPRDGKIVGRIKPSKPARDEDEKSKVSLDTKAFLDKSKLLKNARQGGIVKRTGTVKPAGMVWRKPSDYRLVVFDKWDRAVTICYIAGSERVLESMEGKDVFLAGREYWIQGVRYPVVVADKLEQTE